MTEQRTVAKVTLPKRANEDGEWIVKAYDQHGERFAEADYYAADKADAEGTAKLMLKKV